jgi:hypothetical protein
LSVDKLSIRNHLLNLPFLFAQSIVFDLSSSEIFEFYDRGKTMKIIFWGFIAAVSLTGYVANAEELTPEKFGSYCPADFTVNPPIEFHTNKPLTFTAHRQEELHRLVCEKFDSQTMQLKARWNYYFCEDLNVNNFVEKDFWIAPTSWFTFHPNFKRAEFLLFPKYPKWIRENLLINGEVKELITLHFMRNHESEMKIWFQNSVVNEEEKLKKGAKSIAASIFMNRDLKPTDDFISCEIQ